jgi:hypothetical protein
VDIFKALDSAGFVVGFVGQFVCVVGEFEGAPGVVAGLCEVALFVVLGGGTVFVRGALVHFGGEAVGFVHVLAEARCWPLGLQECGRGRKRLCENSVKGKLVSADESVCGTVHALL